MLPAKRVQRDAHEPCPAFAYCSLPPHHETLSFQSATEFEAHYRNEHAFHCKYRIAVMQRHHVELEGAQSAASVSPRCGKSFPSARFLELHMEECHSSLAQERQQRGEPIFACFEPECPKYFMTPKNRRLHLISVHHYPREFFFSLPLHGINELKARYGEGASLIRKPWKPRGDDAAKNDEAQEEYAPHAEIASHTAPHDETVPHTLNAPHDENVTPSQPLETRTHSAVKRGWTDDDSSSSSSNGDDNDNGYAHNSANPGDNDHDDHKNPSDTDALLSSMTALSLVPRQLRKAK
ncbi:hypothetical protein MCUN1_002567 [Malassezia cuniculi]|uniref:C2H2-type domain-containing protein n=1 Tax=Malassezia cuniculi TaxID=948313 RepID=A0AAF0ES44_9BASI|nr:hypothetical protein MCUN1_002567 [Malassezia cuniculi]